MEQAAYNKTGLINAEETALAEFCMECALKSGASQARVSLSKSVMDSYSMFNGTLDKVTHSADRSIYLYLFIDGRYGTYSTNMLDKEAIESFTQKAVEATRLLAEDNCRCLPEYGRCADNAVTGRELGLYDENYESVTTEQRLKTAADECIFSNALLPEGIRLISEECEYADSVDDNYLIDSQGFRGRHTESAFTICSEITISDSKGRKYSGYWWEASPALAQLVTKSCSRKALEKAIGQTGPIKHKSCRTRMVVDTSVSSRLASPLISALNASSIQQESSFLKDSIGKKIFSEGLTLNDLPLTYGKAGSRLFDTEGVATKNCKIIEKGVVTGYFVNTYMANKMGIAPTIEGVSRPVLEKWQKDSMAEVSDTGTSCLERIISLCGEGILVTGFNGGNCNQSTGYFSYGIEGFAFKDGKITHPVKEMVITGDMVSLWNNLIAAGDDARDCTRWQIPTLAFENVDFSA